MILDIISTHPQLLDPMARPLTSRVVTAAFGYGRHQRDLPADLQGSAKTALVGPPGPGPMAVELT